MSSSFHNQPSRAESCVYSDFRGSVAIHSGPVLSASIVCRAVLLSAEGVASHLQLPGNAEFFALYLLLAVASASTSVVRGRRLSDPPRSQVAKVSGRVSAYINVTSTRADVSVQLMSVKRFVFYFSTIDGSLVDRGGDDVLSVSITLDAGSHLVRHVVVSKDLVPDTVTWPQYLATLEQLSTALFE